MEERPVSVSELDCESLCGNRCPPLFSLLCPSAQETMTHMRPFLGTNAIHAILHHGYLFMSELITSIDGLGTRL